MNVIRQLAETKSVLLISHRLANVVDADRIYVMSEGHICETGTHNELMAAEGEYHRMFMLQQELESYSAGGMAGEAIAGGESCDMNAEPECEPAGAGRSAAAIAHDVNAAACDDGSSMYNAGYGDSVSVGESISESGAISASGSEDDAPGVSGEAAFHDVSAAACGDGSPMGDDGYSGSVSTGEKNSGDEDISGLAADGRRRDIPPGDEELRNIISAVDDKCSSAGKDCCDSALGGEAVGT